MVHAYVVPVPPTQLEHRRLEAELADPSAGLRVVRGQRDLARVVVPRAEEMHRLDVGRGPEGELELDVGHFDGFQVEMVKII
jgi:hypothetical protein